MTKKALLKRGPKISGKGRPPPHNSGNARKKMFFFNWPLPLEQVWLDQRKMIYIRLLQSTRCVDIPFFAPKFARCFDKWFSSFTEIELPDIAFTQIYSEIFLKSTKEAWASVDHILVGFHCSIWSNFHTDCGYGKKFFLFPSLLLVLGVLN